MMHRTISIFFLILLVGIGTPKAYGRDRFARLGVGFANQLKNELPGVSFKIQRSKSFALGGQFAYSSDEDNGGFAAGLKVYRNLFDEPNLTFYASALGALISKNKPGGADSVNGFQFDFTLGSEFNFTGLESLGFSLEFGGSLNKLDEFVYETVGNSFIVSAVHFYL